MLLVFIALTPAIILMLTKAIKDYQQSIDTLHAEAQLLSSQIAMFSKEILPEPRFYLAHLATLPDMQPGSPDCNSFIAQTLKTSYFFDNIFIINKKGIVTCSGLPLEGYISVADRSFYQRALQSKTFSIGDYQLSRQRRVPVVAFASPVLDSAGEVTAVIAATIRLSWFQESVDRALVSTGIVGVEAEAVDERGVIIASVPNPQHAGAIVEGWQKAQAGLGNKQIHTHVERWHDGISKTTAYLPLYTSETANMYLRVGVPRNEMMAAAWRRNAYSLSIMMLFTVLTLGATWWLSGWLILKPVNSLARSAGLLGQGHFQTRSGMGKMGGELGRLASQFDSMAEQLDQQHRTLDRIHRTQSMLGAIQNLILRSASEPTLLEEICQVIYTTGGYQAVWLAFIDEKSPDSIFSRCYSGAGKEEMLAASQAALGYPISDRGPVFSAIDTGVTQLFNHLEKDHAPSLWKQRAVGLAMRSAIGLPIMIGDKVIGGLAIYSGNEDTFLDGEVDLLTQAAADLGLGIAALRSAKKLEQSEEMLSLVVGNIPTMIFVKDAANHQFVSLNKAGERLTGFNANEVIGKTDADLFPADQARLFMEKDIETLKSAETLSITEESVQSKTGTCVLCIPRNCG